MLATLAGLAAPERRAVELAYSGHTYREVATVMQAARDHDDLDPDRPPAAHGRTRPGRRGGRRVLTDAAGRRVEGGPAAPGDDQRQDEGVTRLLGGPWVGRPRAVVLLLLALAVVVDLVSYVVLAGGDEPAAASPDVVALTVTRAVADEDCAGIGGLLADDADLPPAVTACLRGRPGGAALTDLAVVDETTDGGSSRVVVALRADGTRTAVVVDLRRDGDRWRVTGVRARR